MNPSMGARSDIPIAHGPEERYRTPSAMCKIKDHWFLQVELQFAEAGVGGSAYQDLTRQDVEDERHMDVLERVLVSTTTHRSPTPANYRETMNMCIVRMQQLHLVLTRLPGT